ncbi:hypothetical protein D3C76_1252000 [compost metagenome]
MRCSGSWTHSTGKSDFCSIVKEYIEEVSAVMNWPPSCFSILMIEEEGTVSITSVHHKKALEVSADGTTLSLCELDPTLDRQKWVITN